MILNDDYNPAGGEKIPFATVLTNRGNVYNVERREFICPEEGLYAFYVGAYGRNSAICRLDITLNGEDVNRAYVHNAHASTGTTMAVLELESGDLVAVTNFASGCNLHGEERLTSFSGFRIN